MEQFDKCKNKTWITFERVVTIIQASKCTNDIKWPIPKLPKVLNLFWHCNWFDSPCWITTKYISSSATEITDFDCNCCIYTFCCSFFLFYWADWSLMENIVWPIEKIMKNIVQTFQFYLKSKMRYYFDKLSYFITRCQGIFTRNVTGPLRIPRSHVLIVSFQW